MSQAAFSPALALYRAATSALAPFAGLWLDLRARGGKEDRARLSERYGHAARPRPAGRLIWLHGASVGEAGVALHLAEALAARDSLASFLFTSGTATSAQIIARRMPARALHVYAPLDNRRVVQRFLEHWRPDLGVFVESELWPNLILNAEARRIPMALLNARLSPHSIRSWTHWPKAARRLFDAFALVLAADRRTADAISALRTTPASHVGNLKLAAAPAAVDAAAQAALQSGIGARPVWLGASTHDGEEEILLAAHARLRAIHPDALLILAPRHPKRGARVSALAGGAPRRALQQEIGGASVYVADTLGELSLFYASVGAAFIGGSLLARLKGHNPVEAAKLGAAIVTGPHVESFEDLFADLFAADAATRAATPESIADAIATLWRDPDARARQIAAAQRVVETGGAAMDETVARLAALLPARAVETNAADAPA